MPKPSPFLVDIPREEFARLQEAHPAQARLLKELARPHGPKTHIWLRDVEAAAVQARLGQALSDRLHRLACRLKPETYFSYFLQLSELLALPKSRAGSILEVGAGAGVFAALARHYGYQIMSLDVEPRFCPDVRGDVLSLPLRSKSVDVVCAFEVLQHLPHRHFEAALSQMAQTARHYVLLSLPCKVHSLDFKLKLNWLTGLLKRLSFEVAFFHVWEARLPDVDEREFEIVADKRKVHYWEVNRLSHPKKRIIDEIKGCGLKIIKQFHSPLHPYHFFVVAQVDGA